jgi:hypothetical protein
MKTLSSRAGALIRINGLLLLLTLAVWMGGVSTAAAAEITPEGQKLAEVLDSMHVEQLWIAGHQVNWRTGEPTGKAYTDANLHTHCSAFAAAAAERLGVYLLHPPEHSAYLLANAQEDWLMSAGTNEGWYSIKSPLQAQQLANEGQLVVVVCKNPDKAKPGHIAIVRPSLWSDDKILSDGPNIIQAGAHNYTSTTTREGFKNHPGAFENDQLLYFAHTVSYSGMMSQGTAKDKPDSEEISESTVPTTSQTK